MHATFSKMRIGSLNLPHDQQVRTYVEHYQRGSGILPAFEGSMYQDGNGLGDILKSVVRLVLPIVTSGASTFVKNTAHGLSEGKSLGDAATNSLGETAKKVVKKTVKRVVQKGKGRGGKCKMPNRVYKRKRQRPQKSKKRYTKRRKLTILPVNF